MMSDMGIKETIFDANSDLPTDFFERWNAAFIKVHNTAEGGLMDFGAT